MAVLPNPISVTPDADVEGVFTFNAGGEIVIMRSSDYERLKKLAEEAQRLKMEIKELLSKNKKLRSENKKLRSEKEKLQSEIAEIEKTVALMKKGESDGRF